MARQPFFGQTPGIQSRGMNMQVATQGARDMARGMANFGQAVGGMMQKFKAKKEKEEVEGKAEQALLAMGLPPEVAKAGSKDKSLISSFMQTENLKLNKERTDAYKAGIQAKTEADEMQKRLDTAEAEERSAERILYNEDQYGNTHAENTFGNLSGLIPEDRENQPFGTFGATLKHIRALNDDKETRKAFDNFTGDVTTLFDPSHKDYAESSAQLLRFMGDKGPGALKYFADIGHQQRMAKQAEEEDKPWEAPEPKAIDLDKDGKVDGHTLHTSKNSLQFISASGKEHRLPVEMIMNQEIIRMKNEGDVDGLIVALRNQYRTVTNEDMMEVQKLPPEIQKFIEDAKKNQKKQP